MPREAMAPEILPLIYDLGEHVLEVSASQTVLITGHPTQCHTITELIQLDRDEVYKLFITLQEVFHSVAE